MHDPAMDRRWAVVAFVAVLARPWLWWTAVRQLLLLARPGWWRRAPFLPVPDREYLRFRLVTQYGDPSRVPVPRDVVGYLRWCRSYRAITSA